MVPDPSSLKPYLDLLVSPGVPVVITALVLYLAIKYIPKVIDNRLEKEKLDLKSGNESTKLLVQSLREQIKEYSVAIKEVQAEHIACTHNQGVLQGRIDELGKIRDEIIRLWRHDANNKA